ncbi:MAG: glycosyltransferase family 2 protein [Smithella sp.]|jgi:hypothetical protein
MDLSIIIVNYNCLSWLENLLPSLQTCFLSQTRLETEVIVVDNGSTDNSVAWLETISWIRLIRSGHNGGFAYANNLALRESTAKYVMLLNSDTELFPETSNLEVLTEYLDQHDDTGIVTPLVLLDNHRQDPACHRGEPTPWAAFTYLSGLEKCFPGQRWSGSYHQAYKPLTTIHEIDACTAAAMMVRRSVLDKVGLLDERFFMYAEDLDWCKRFRENGYRVVFLPEVTILHHKYQSGLQNKNKETREFATSLFYEAMLEYYDKHYKDEYPRIFRFFLKTFLTIEKRKHRNKLLKY